MIFKKMTLACLGSAALIVAGAGVATAGEVTGNGKSTPIREGVSNSICSFSGLNNDPVPDAPGRTQSYGQGVRAGFKEAPGSVFHPGAACNGHTGFFAGGGGEG